MITRIKNVSLWLVFFACTLVASLGAMSWATSGGTFDTFAQPMLMPPDWIFGPVWFVLYLLIATAGYRSVKGTSSIPFNKEYAMGFWALQMCLNVVWTPIFFGAFNFGLALLVAIFMLLSIGGFIYQAYRFERVSFYLMMPYFLWVCFATYLTSGFYLLN